MSGTLKTETYKGNNVNFILKICLLLSCLFGIGAEAATPAQTAQEELHYHAKKGEFLVLIAANFADQFPGITWRSLAKDNKLTDPSLIQEGQLIVIKAPSTKTAKVTVPAPTAPIAIAEAATSPAEAAVPTMRNHGQSISCAKVRSGMTFAERQVNIDNCARIRAARKQYASAQAARSVQTASYARPVRVTHSSTPADILPEPVQTIAQAIDPTVKAMIDEELSEIKGGLEDVFGPSPNITPLAWVILLRRHGVLPDARTAELSLRIPDGEPLVVSTFPFDIQKE